MSNSDITRVPNPRVPAKSSVAVYRLPGGGGFLWGRGDLAPTGRRTSASRTLGALGVIDGYLKDAGLDRTRIVKAEIVVTDHDNKPAFDEAWATWMPAQSGPGPLVRPVRHARGRPDRDHHHGGAVGAAATCGKASCQSELFPQ
jgi:hypothetical protein